MSRMRPFRERKAEQDVPPRVVAVIRREVASAMQRHREQPPNAARRPLRDGGAAAVRGGSVDRNRPVTTQDVQRIVNDRLQARDQQSRTRAPSPGQQDDAESRTGRTQRQSTQQARSREPIVARMERRRQREQTPSSAMETGRGAFMREAAMFGPQTAIMGAIARRPGAGRVMAGAQLARGAAGVIERGARATHGITAALEGAQRTELGDDIRRMMLDVQNSIDGMRTWMESVQNALERRQDIFLTGGETSMAQDNRFRRAWATVEQANKEVNNAVDSWRSQRINRQWSEQQAGFMGSFPTSIGGAITKLFQQGSEKP